MVFRLSVAVTLLVAAWSGRECLVWVFGQSTIVELLFNLKIANLLLQAGYYLYIGDFQLL